MNDEKKEKPEVMHRYNWKDRIPAHIAVADLTQQQHHRLITSNNFCMIPWIHLNATPDGRAYPCCLGQYEHPIGSLKVNTIEEIWNDAPYKLMRKNMLEDKPCKECTNCYEAESNGITSMRNSSNKFFGHQIADVENTLPDGTNPDFKLHYWDIRFNNICNLKCRSCGTLFSSRWYEDDIKLWGKELLPRVMFAGKHHMDVWEQMQTHMPYLSKIYFAGGEPLLQEEHIRILKKLIELGNTNVELVYNTNLTTLKFKRENILELWKHFKHVCVMASLDDYGKRAEVIRSGTNWPRIEKNIKSLKQQCPHIDFGISPTLSIMNIWNICKFHRYMVDQGFIGAADVNVNLLMHPAYYRIDMIPTHIKHQLKEEIEKHLDWLRPLDQIGRATGGFEGAIKSMMADDKSHMLKDFWKNADALDRIRNEKIIDSVPELSQLR